MVLYSGEHKLGIIHFIGIGGIGISGIAEILHNLGYSIQGSDLHSNCNTERLKKFGISIAIGHSKENVGAAKYVVISSAITDKNVEVIEAQKLKIPILKRAEMLAELMRFKYSIAVSGSHGKTTATAMIGHLFEYYRKEPTLINGGIVHNRNTNAYIGSSQYLIAEADESDGTFTEIPLNIAVITNIDREHLGFYKNFDNLKNAFKNFIKKVPFYGFAVVCGDDPEARQIISQIENRQIITYGIDGDNLNVKAVNIVLENFSSHFDLEVNIIHMERLVIKNINLGAPGEHNILNSLAAFAIAVQLCFDHDLLPYALKNYSGVNRRFTQLGEYNGALVIDDYAHHPKEIKATLKAARLVANERGGSLIAIFQPHRYSRTQELMEDFFTSFRDADKIFISDIFSAGEDDIYSVNSSDIVRGVRDCSTATIIASFSYSKESLDKLLKEYTQDTDLVIFMGAGDITQWANNLFDSNR